MHIMINKTLDSLIIKLCFPPVQPDLEVDWCCRFESDPVEGEDYTNILVMCGKINDFIVTVMMQKRA